MSVELSALINPALRIAGITDRPGRTPSTDQSTEVIGITNRMIGSWNCDQLKIYSTSIDRYALSPSQTDYYIGPTGDFVAPRPVEIKRANIVLTNTSPEQHIQMRILTDDDWSEKRFPELPGGAWPRQIYNGGEQPDSLLHLYPFPTIACDLELFTFSALRRDFADLTDVVDLPDGYEEAIVFNLALRVAAHFPTQARLAPEAPEMARASLAAIMSRNAPVIRLKNDAARIGARGHKDGSRWWLSGGLS